MNISKIAVILILQVLFLQACRNAFILKDGNTAYDLSRYSVAAELLQKDFNAAKDNLSKRTIAAKIGQSYLQYSDFSAAEKWFKTAAELENIDAYYQLGKVQMMEHKYEEAKKNFTIYSKQDAVSKNRAAKELKNCDNAISAMKADSSMIIKNLQEINTASREYAPFIAAEKIYFSSNRSNTTGENINAWTGQRNSDIYFFDKKNKTIVNIKSPVNTVNSEGKACFTKDGKEMYFTRCGIVDDQAKVRKDEYCNIFHTSLINGEWDEPQPLSLFNDSTNVGHPALLPDGKTLIVSAHTIDGLGGRDLYYFTKNDTGWTGPYNLGANINTTGDEMFPWVDAKGNLYFSSNGMSGFGGLDIYRASKYKSTWRNPSNMGWGINSGADDFGIFITKTKPTSIDDTILTSGYFSSNRIGGKGEDDLYFYEEKWSNTFLLTGITYENEYENPEDGDSKIIGKKSLTAVSLELRNATTDAVVSTFKSNASGFYSQPLDAETDYKLIATKPGYFATNITFSTRGKKNQDSTEIKINTSLLLDKIFPQKEIVIPNIYYDYDKATLRPESKLVLDSILVFFNDNKDLLIEIGSHTDSRGSDEYNQKLSQARAQSVVDYLIEKGVANDRLVAKGYGETKLVNNCGNDVPCSEEEHQRNRRTTFRITGSKANIESIEPENIEQENR